MLFSRHNLLIKPADNTLDSSNYSSNYITPPLWRDVNYHLANRQLSGVIPELAFLSQKGRVVAQAGQEMECEQRREKA